MIKITGASGFIGEAVVDFCRSHSIPFIAYTRSKNTKNPLLSYISNYAEIPPGGCLIHLGEHNTIATINSEIIEEQHKTIRKLAKAEFDQILYVSSAAVYQQSPFPIKSDSEIYSDSQYAKSKLANEAEVLKAGGIVVRLSNVIGTNMSRQNVLSTICDQRDSAVIKVQNLKPVRDYIWIDDVSSAIVKLALSKEKGIYNISTGVGTSVLELIRMICKISNNTNFRVIETDPGGESTIVLDSLSTTQKTGWRPKVDLISGLAKILGVT